ncbi:MAG: universal stress protein [Bacteroidales bacterium]|nr:universal stress protein [Bacteroidales bacterium]
MRLLEKILLPIDITCNSTEQVNCTIKLAKAFNSSVIIAYILPMDASRESIKDIVQDAVDTKLQEITSQLEQNEVPVLESIVEFGNPYESIIDISENHDVNLIILTSGDKSLSEPYKLGTTAEKVMRKTDKPVWVIKNYEGTSFSNILCPVDFSTPSKRALKNAVQLARKFKAAIKVLHVIEPVINSKLEFDNCAIEGKDEYIAWEKKLKDFLKDINLDGVDLTTELQEGLPHDRILQTIQKGNHDLLVMGTTGRTGLSRLFMGSVTEKVTREVPCTFVTMKSENLLTLHLDSEIKEIESHLDTAKKLVENGYYKEAINQYKICLQINDMHVPSMYRIANLYKKLGQETEAALYDSMAKEILSRLWDKKIEFEVRKLYKDN